MLDISQEMLLCCLHTSHKKWTYFQTKITHLLIFILETMKNPEIVSELVYRKILNQLKAIWYIYDKICGIKKWFSAFIS